MIVIVGSFRLAETPEARSAMREVIANTSEEPGCRWYSYARDLLDPEVIRVSEGWADKASLEAHFATPHMAMWQAARERLGFSERRIFACEAGEPEPL
jgi:quinol monooxygenase YgiN